MAGAEKHHDRTDGLTPFHPAPYTDHLTAADLEVLEFARATWTHVGRRDVVILERFGHSPTRYFQRLNYLIDHPLAQAYDPINTARLRRLRTRRANQRTALNRGVIL